MCSAIRINAVFALNKLLKLEILQISMEKYGLIKLLSMLVMVFSSGGMLFSIVISHSISTWPFIKQKQRMSLFI